MKTLIVASMLLALPAPAIAGARNVQSTTPPEVYLDQGGHHNGGVGAGGLTVRGTTDRAQYDKARRAAIKWCVQHHGKWRRNHCILPFHTGDEG